MARDDYTTGRRIRDNTKHADAVRSYWADAGYMVNVRVCVLTGEIISDMVNGLPRNIDPKDIPQTHTVPRDAIEKVEADFLKIYDVKMKDVRTRAGISPQALSARNSIWHALHTELGMTHQAIAQRYNRSRNTVTYGIKHAEGE